MCYTNFNFSCELKNRVVGYVRDVKKMINIAIMGHGVVGSGVAEVLRHNRDIITSKAKNEINIKYILDLREFPDLEYSDLFIKDFEKIINDPDIAVVAEVMGGIHPAYDYVKRCLECGKNVVTSNKELVAAKGSELLSIAAKMNVNFLFEASVGGGIPILRPLAQCLAANEITEISGILNGTTNFILTKMVRDNLSFADALKLAQDNGYAEKNPDADILGFDACRKICILASLGFGRHVYPEQVSTVGITEVTLDDVDYADRLGHAIKLIGHAKKLDNGKISATVYPALVPHSNILSDVNGVYNAVVVKGDATDDVMFYGKGAGKLPTASAVVADIIDCVKHLTARKYLFWEDSADGYIEDPENLLTGFYARVKCDDTDAVSKEITDIFGKDCKILVNKISGEIVFLTGMGIEKQLKKQINGLGNCEIKAVLHTL